MNQQFFSRKVRDYGRLLQKPYWHLFEVAEYASGITNLDMLEYGIVRK